MAKKANTGEAIDAELKKYYKLMGNDSYNDDQGNGKFLAFFAENEFDDDDIDDELGENVTHDSCSYLDFDDDFPLGDDETIKNTDEEIFKILQKIYLTGTFLDQQNDEKTEEPTTKTSKNKPTINDEKNDAPPIMFGLNYQVTKGELANAVNVCKQQIPFIGNDGFNDESLMTFIAVGIKNGIPLLSAIVDCYNRDRVIAKLKGDSIEQNTWHRHCHQISQFQKFNKKVAQKLLESITSYTHRIAPRLQLEPVTKINDSLKDIASYIATFFAIVNARLLEINSVPFHMDFVIAAKNASSGATTMAVPDISDDEDGGYSDDEDGNEDDDDDDDYGKKLPVQNELEKFFSEFGECLVIDLKDNPIHHLQNDLLKDDYNKNDENFKFELENFQRKVDVLLQYKDFRKKLKKNAKLKIKDNFPRQRRLCAFVDRRNDGNDDEKSNDEGNDKFAWYFSQKYNSVAQEPRAPESFLLASRKCNLGVLDSYKGQTITVSFHVEQEDQVRCYLFWNGQQIRFYPQDIVDLLPLLFVPGNENEEFAKSEELIQIAKSIQIKDAFFESFYRSMHQTHKFPRF